MGSGDYYLKIWEDAAAELDLEYDSFEYQEIEGLFWDDPITFVKRYGKALSLEQREHLGYFDVVHGLPEGKEPTKQEILDNWPKPYNQPHLWNKELLKEIHIRRKAFLIGCSKYKSSSFNDLTCPHLDVIAVKKILENKEIGQFGNIISLPENTSAEKAKKQIKDFITSSISGDTLLIYFSGHGFASMQEDKIYLALSNTQDDEPETAIEGGFLVECFSQSQCSSLLLILDCCQSGAISSQLGVHFREKPKLPKKKYNQVFGHSGFRVITASTRGEESYEDPNNGLSVFTSCLLEGIEMGKADVDANGAITDFEAFNYATRKLISLKLNEEYMQTPTINVIDGRTSYLLALNSNILESPTIEETEVEHLDKYLGVKSMVELVNSCQPIDFKVSCLKYYFVSTKGGFAYASSLNVSSTHTPYLRQTNFGFQCETYFLENMVPDKAKLNKPINHLVKTRLNIHYEDIKMIYGVDIRNGYKWKLFIPEGTVFK